MARKSKGFSELLNQQRAGKIEQVGMEKLRQKIKSSPLGDQVSLVMNPSGVVKMSEVLEEFVDPYLDFARTRQQRRKLFEVAVLAWNLTLLPEDSQQQMVEKIIEEGITGRDPLARQDTRQILNEMMERKEQLFADNKRYIVNFNLQDTGQTFHLSVASTLMKQPTEDEPASPEVD
jgi:hypothetical protein